MTKLLPILLVPVTLCAICIAKPINMLRLQSPNVDKIYTADEVDIKANIKHQLDHLPLRNSDCPSSVQVTLKVVLRKSGKVTDIIVLKSSGCSYDQQAIKAAAKLEFEPALKGGYPVSQYAQLDYNTAPSEWPGVSSPTTISASPTGTAYGLLLDQSGSKENFEYISAAARIIINAHRPSDEAFIVGFVGADRIQNLQELTSNKVRLINCLSQLQAAGGKSPIVDAVYVSAQYLLQVRSNSRTRPALVLITQGDDQSSYYKLDQLLLALRQYHVPVYILAYANGVKEGKGTKRYEKAIALINKLARESDGELILADNPKDIEARAAEIVRLLQHE